MNDRLMIAAMAMQGMYTNERYNSISFADTANEALKQADALLAAAGEKESCPRCVAYAADRHAAESKLAACEREMDALCAKVTDLEMYGERRESINQGLKHEIGMLALEIASLKRRYEGDLTDEDCMYLNNVPKFKMNGTMYEWWREIDTKLREIRARRA